MSDVQDPHQLLAIYGQLEQENLFLIQASQEAEEGLEAAQAQLSSIQVRDVIIDSGVAGVGGPALLPRQDMRVSGSTAADGSCLQPSSCVPGIYLAQPELLPHMWLG